MTALNNNFDSKSQINFISSGNKANTAIVFLHGIGSGAESWTHQLQAIDDNTYVIAWNAPGYANSAQIKSLRPTALDYSARLYDLVKSLGLTRIHLVGHSLGALIATGFASQHPELINTLILANAAQGYKYFDQNKQEDVANLRPKLLQELGGTKMARQRSGALMHKPTEQNISLLEEVMERITLDGYKKASRLLAHDSIHQYLSHINQPIHLIYGTEDGITKPEGMLDMANKYSNITLHPIKDAGHLSYLDQPEAFNTLTKSIIKDQ